tara:strand:+ start:441 stop:923 length:483 start_codon:yes stop_codon:yes gene_type:complete
MKEIENILPIDKFLNIKKIIQEPVFPWYLNKGVVDDNDGHIQFFHMFYEKGSITSDRFNLFEDIFKILKVKTILKIKANLLQRTNTIIEHGYHVDFDYPEHDATTAVLYMNNNNGYTKFKSGEKVYSEENKIVVFPSRVYHTGSTCTDEELRLVINFNYY